MKKVCHITSIHSRYDVRIFEKECSTLAEIYNVYLIVNDKLENEKKNNVSIISTSWVPKNRLQRLFMGRKKIYLAAVKLKPDIIHFHDPDLLSIALKLKRKLKCKVIFDSHENTIGQIEEKKYIPCIFRKIVQSSYRKYQEIVCKKIDGIITIDPIISKIFTPLNKNVEVIENYPILQLLKNERKENRSIVFAGGITEQWNHKSIIKALEDIPDVTYYLCGLADKTYLGELQSMSGWDKVKYYGAIPHERVMSILQKATLGIALCSYSSNSNGKIGTYGNTKLFEIMMAKIPVLCTDFEVWEGIVSIGQCGLCVTPNSVAQIKQAIQKCFNDLDYVKKMGNNGRYLIEKKYNWNISKKKLLAFYERIILEG